MTATGHGTPWARRRDEEFAEFVSTRSGWLRKVAYLLTGDWHRADDLAQATLTKLFVRWHRLGGVENVDGYARQTLVNSFLAERRSPWGRVLLGRGEKGEDGPPPVAPQHDLDAALDLHRALAELPPRQRATVVLRYFCDLTVEQTAETLGCSTGTVKSQTARGLDALRRVLAPEPEPTATGGNPS